jgi:hypothetical protein
MLLPMSSLPSKLTQYHQAIQQEFATLEAAVEKGDAESLRDAARRALTVNFKDYLQELTNLALYAEGEGARLSAIKLVLSLLLDDRNGKDESIEQLIKELSGTETKG